MCQSWTSCTMERLTLKLPLDLISVTSQLASGHKGKAGQQGRGGCDCWQPAVSETGGEDSGRDGRCALRLRFVSHVCRRLRVKKDLQLKLAASKEKPGSEDEAASDAGSESSLDEEEKILEEMDDVRSKAAARLKKERKKRRESKRKARIRAAQLALSMPPSHMPFPLILRSVI